MLVNRMGSVAALMMLKSSACSRRNAGIFFAERQRWAPPTRAGFGPSASATHLTLAGGMSVAGLMSISPSAGSSPGPPPTLTDVNGRSPRTLDARVARAVKGDGRSVGQRADERMRWCRRAGGRSCLSCAGRDAGAGDAGQRAAYVVGRGKHRALGARVGEEPLSGALRGSGGTVHRCSSSSSASFASADTAIAPLLPRSPRAIAIYHYAARSTAPAGRPARTDGRCRPRPP